MSKQLSWRTQISQGYFTVLPANYNLVINYSYYSILIFYQ